MRVRSCFLGASDSNSCQETVVSHWQPLAGLFSKMVVINMYSITKAGFLVFQSGYVVVLCLPITFAFLDWLMQ